MSDQQQPQNNSNNAAAAPAVPQQQEDETAAARNRQQQQQQYTLRGLAAAVAEQQPPPPAHHHHPHRVASINNPQAVLRQQAHPPAPAPVILHPQQHPPAAVAAGIVQRGPFARGAEQQLPRNAAGSHLEQQHPELQRNLVEERNDDDDENNNNANSNIGWSEVETNGVPPSARSLHSAALLNGVLYVFGGCKFAHDLLVCSAVWFASIYLRAY